jgi:hypothetical protein
MAMEASTGVNLEASSAASSEALVLSEGPPRKLSIVLLVSTLILGRLPFALDVIFKPLQNF